MKDFIANIDLQQQIIYIVESNTERYFVINYRTYRNINDVFNIIVPFAFNDKYVDRRFTLPRLTVFKQIECSDMNFSIEKCEHKIEYCIQDTNKYKLYINFINAEEEKDNEYNFEHSIKEVNFDFPDYKFHRSNLISL